MYNKGLPTMLHSASLVTRSSIHLQAMKHSTRIHKRRSAVQQPQHCAPEQVSKYMAQSRARISHPRPPRSPHLAGSSAHGSAAVGCALLTPPVINLQHVDISSVGHGVG